MCCDINNFYLVTPMERYEYICLPTNIILEEILVKYNLRAMEKIDISTLISEKGFMASHRWYK